MAEVGTGVLVAFKRLKICSFITINDTVILHKDTNDDKFYILKKYFLKTTMLFFKYTGVLIQYTAIPRVRPRKLQS